MLSSGAVGAIVLALWVASGRVSLTKSSRSVTVQVRDDLFGDVTAREEFERGPIFGYFIGLDAVGAIFSACIIASVVAWVLTRGRAGQAPIEARRET